MIKKTHEKKNKSMAQDSDKNNKLTTIHNTQFIKTSFLLHNVCKKYKVNYIIITYTYLFFFNGSNLRL